MMAPRLEEIFYIGLCIGLACSQIPLTTTESKALTTVSTSSSLTQAPNVTPNTNSTGLSQETTTNSTGASQETTTNSTGASQETTTNSTGASQETTTNSTGASQEMTTNSTGASQETTTAPPNGSVSSTMVTANTVVPSNSTATQKTADGQTSSITFISPSTQSTSTNTVGTSTVTVNSTEHHTLDPGLIALIVILVAILLIGLFVTAVKYSHQGKPEFKRLQELPMNSLSEEAPFAQYPPK